jgi:hypothetical protein
MKRPVRKSAKKPGHKIARRILAIKPRGATKPIMGAGGTRRVPKLPLPTPDDDEE